MREILTESTRLGYSISNVTTRQIEGAIQGAGAVAVTLEVHGQPTIEPLTLALNDLHGVHEVAATDLAQPAE